MFTSNEEYTPFPSKLWLSSPTMHGPELACMQQAYESNWMSTIGKNINEIERLICERVGCRHGIALSSGTAALHMSVKLAGERLFGKPWPGHGALEGRKVFCSDLTFAATVNPVVYEGGVPVFIDTERDTWNMDPLALEQAFALYPETRLVVLAHLYGVPGKIDEIKEVCESHGAVLIEDAAESLGASYKGRQTGTFGDYSCISFNGNKIITGSSGGMLLTEDGEGAEKVRRWSTQARENAPWYQHEEVGYNYRMSNVIAGVVRGQFPYLEEHISRKKEIYERYKEGLKRLPIEMNPYDEKNSEPNFWLSCLMVKEEGLSRQERGAREAWYERERGKSCPTEILEALDSINAEGRPIWKPLHLQPMYQMHPFITRYGRGRAVANACQAEGTEETDSRLRDKGADIFERGLCLPSDIKMTKEQQEKVIEVVRACFE